METERLVRTQITSSELDPSSELVQSVNNGETQLLAVVKALGPFLTATEDDVRLKGVTYLANLVKVVNPAQVNGPAARTLTNFFLSKMDEFDALPPSLAALLVLSKLPSFDDDAALSVYQMIVEGVNMKAHAQATRHQVYLVFDSLLAKHRQVLKSMGPEFISSYTKMVDGEKDPRNLMLLFQMDRVILREFNIESQIEDMFDITFCYFPITFRPPPNDPYGITADDLKLELRGCMAATPLFAKMAIPLFLEKFVTASGPTMRDLLLTMAACFEVYGAEAVSERGDELWEAIKTEVLYSSDAGIEAAALSALESLVRTLYPDSDTTPSGLGQEIIKQSLSGLAEPEKNAAAGSVKSLAAMVRASPSAGSFALSQAFPQLFRQFNRPTLPSHRTPILNSITTLLLAARSVYAAPDATRRQDQERSLEPFREPLLDVLREGLRSEGLKVAAVRGSVALVEIPGFWGKTEVEEVVRAMDDLLINDRDPEVQSVVLEALRTIAATHADVVQAVTLSLLFHTLPEEAPKADDGEAREKYRAILASLTALCTLPALFETLVVRIVTKLDLLSTTDAGPEDAESRRECTVAYAWDLLHALQVVIDRKLEEKHVDVAKAYSQVVPRLFGFVIAAALLAAEASVIEPLFRDRRLIKTVASIVETLLWEQNQEKQTAAFKVAYDGFESGNFAGAVHNPATLEKLVQSPPLRANAPRSEQDLVVLYSAVVQGLKADVGLPFISASDFLRSKALWAIRGAGDEFELQYMLELITAFVNKRAGEMAESLGELLEQIWIQDIQDTEQPKESRHRGLLVYLHIVRGLALTRNPLAYTAVQRIVEVLGLSSLDPWFVGEAARGLGVLARPAGKAKGKGPGVHLTTKLLYAQKLWAFILPSIIEGEKDTTRDHRQVYLVAFASLLPLVPTSLYLSDLSNILPLLLRSLSLENPAQRINVVVALTSIFETASSSTATDKLLHEYAETLVDGILASALRSSPLKTSPDMRAAALVALGVVPDAIRYETLSGAKARVVRELAAALDDPSRSVRREAVDTRAKWYRYGTT